MNEMTNIFSNVWTGALDATMKIMKIISRQRDNGFIKYMLAFYLPYATLTSWLLLPVLSNYYC